MTRGQRPRRCGSGRPGAGSRAPTPPGMARAAPANPTGSPARRRMRWRVPAIHRGERRGRRQRPAGRGPRWPPAVPPPAGFGPRRRREGRQPARTDEAPAVADLRCRWASHARSDRRRQVRQGTATGRARRPPPTSRRADDEPESLRRRTAGAPRPGPGRPIRIGRSMMARCRPRRRGGRRGRGGRPGRGRPASRPAGRRRRRRCPIPDPWRRGRTRPPPHRTERPVSSPRAGSEATRCSATISRKPPTPAPGRRTARSAAAANRATTASSMTSARSPSRPPRSLAVASRRARPVRCHTRHRTSSAAGCAAPARAIATSVTTRSKGVARSAGTSSGRCRSPRSIAAITSTAGPWPGQAARTARRRRRRLIGSKPPTDDPSSAAATSPFRDAGSTPDRRIASSARTTGWSASGVDGGPPATGTPAAIRAPRIRAAEAAGERISTAICDHGTPSVRWARRS